MDPDGNRLQLLCVYMHLLVLWSSCLATKFLVSKYLATRRVVVSGSWGNGLDRQAPLIEAHSTMHLMDVHVLIWS